MFHFFHKYTKWAVVREGRILNEKDWYVGTYMVQERVCTVCGYVQRKRTNIFQY